MRDPKRIPEVLHALQELWELAPDLRFQQVLCLLEPEGEPFYIEDDKWIEIINATAQRYKKILPVQEKKYEIWVGEMNSEPYYYVETRQFPSRTDALVYAKECAINRLMGYTNNENYALFFAAYKVIEVK